jgi:uncharacterized repeat protein (TIGR03943 family)
VRRETQNVLLVLLGGAVLKIAMNGQYTNYVKPSLQPWLIIAGAATIVLAVVGIVRDIRAGGPTGGHGHDHGSRSPWLLLLPALAIFLVAPPALGADKVARSGTVAAQPAPSGAEFVALPDGDAPLLRMGDAVTRAVWDDSGTLDDREIRLIGFVARAEDGSVQLARFAIGCCAADATPIKVRLAGSGLDSYESDTWLEARGKIISGSASEANGYVPTFQVASVDVVPAPPDPYES